MARFRRVDVYRTIEEDGLVPVFYHADPETAFQVAHACARAGVRTFEFTNRGDGAAEVFASILPRLRDAAPSLILGVGSIGDPYTAGLYLASGANFVVGPSLNPEVAKLCNRRKVAYAPGCGSATEVATAEELGCEIVKVFPGNSVGGPDFVKSVLGPCPWTSMMPTGGVEPTRESLEKWFGAGIVAAGIGSKLMPKDAVATGDWSTVESTVRGTLETIASIRAAT